MANRTCTLVLCTVNMHTEKQKKSIVFFLCMKRIFPPVFLKPESECK